MKTPLVLEKTTIEQMAEIGRLRLPNEACGVLIPPPGWKGQQVFELPNRSKTPADSFVMSSDDIVMTLEEWAAEYSDPSVWSDITIWHTHPSGAVGPSKADMENKIEQCGNLVLSLPAEGDPLPTWF